MDPGFWSWGERCGWRCGELAPRRGVSFCCQGHGNLPEKWRGRMQTWDLEGPLAAPGTVRAGGATAGAPEPVADLSVLSRLQGIVLLYEGGSVR